MAIPKSLSPESQLWSKNKKSKILHPEKEYFFSAFPSMVIVSERMTGHENDRKLARLKLRRNALSHKNLWRCKKIITHKKQRIAR